jgi:hypothetical protein
MARQGFLVIQKKTVRAKIFEDEGGNDFALEALENDNGKYAVAYMSELVDARIEARVNSLIWKNWLHTPSIKVTGRTKQGTPVVIYAHIPNKFSTSLGMVKAIQEEGLVNG